MTYMFLYIFFFQCNISQDKDLQHLDGGQLLSSEGAMVMSGW